VRESYTLDRLTWYTVCARGSNNERRRSNQKQSGSDSNSTTAPLASRMRVQIEEKGVSHTSLSALSATRAVAKPRDFLRRVVIMHRRTHEVGQTAGFHVETR